MDREIVRELLAAVRGGQVSVAEALERLRFLPFEDLGYARLDHHRSLRRGLGEVIFAPGKEEDEIIEIMAHMQAQRENILVTRLSAARAAAVQARFPESTYAARAGVLTLLMHPVPPAGLGTILVLSAGTADLPVAEEAVVTARFFGNTVATAFDTGVAGLHRVLSLRAELSAARVIIVAAGMEGALPSVVAGLVDRPVIAVPTSTGYGASFGGLAALLAMLNACAAGVTVVNIDNGFGAAYAATLMNRA